MGSKTTNRDNKPLDIGDYYFNNMLSLGIAAAMGKILDVETGNKFGQVALLSIIDGRVPVNEMKESYPYQTTAFTPYFSSDDAGDALAGIGAQKIFVDGNDGADGSRQTEIIELNGLSAVNSQLTWSAINRMFVLQIGSSETAIGQIYCGLGAITLGVPAIKLAKINNGNNQTQMCQLTVPKGYTCIIKSITYTVVAGKPMIFHDEIRNRDALFDSTHPFRNVRTINVETNYSLQLDPPTAVGELSDVRITTLATQNNSNGECAFRYILVPTDWYERRL